MADILSPFTAIWQGMDLPMTIGGFTFSFRDVFIFSWILAIICTFIGGVLHD